MRFGNNRNQAPRPDSATQSEDFQGSCCAHLAAAPKTWLITGVAGFIGCNLLEALLKLDQTVVGLDNFATGHRHNLDQIRAAVSAEQWARFRFIEGDIRRLDDCRDACAGVDVVLHQAALGSVPRSLEDPMTTNAVQANLLAATVEQPEAVNQVYNVAVGKRTSLNELFEAIRAALVPRFAHLEDFKPSDRDFRPGDVRHALADVASHRRCGFSRIGKSPVIVGAALAASAPTPRDSARLWSAGSQRT